MAQMGTPYFSHLFTVRGDGDFPLDNLRADRCWFSTEEDSVLAGRAKRGPRGVTLQHLDASMDWRPDLHLWAEAGWRVVSFGVSLP